MNLQRLVLLTTLSIAPFALRAQQTPTSTPGGSTPPSTGSANPPATTKPNSGPTGDGPVTASKDDLDKARAEAAKNNNEPIPEPGDELRKKIKKGSIDDVDAAGTRDIGGRGMVNWFSTDW